MAPKLRVAIVCDWLVGTGGAERVVYELHQMFPQAPIYTSQYNRSPQAWYGHDWFKGAEIKVGWLQKLPLTLRKFLPVLRAWYFSHLDLRDYDLVITSSGAEAKAVKTRPGAHVWYCHAPTHYYWARYEQYLKHPGFGRLDFLARLGLKLLVGPMRHWDKKAAQKPDYVVANSSYIKGQIKKYYSRDSQVIHPPVDISRFKKLNKLSNLRSGFVAAGRQTPYKRLDLAVKTCSQLGLPLTVIGNGPDHDRLVKVAGSSVRFETSASDEEVVNYFASAAGFIFPGIDDFGIVAVEALAAGTPVVAYKAGGALDYVQPGKTGEFFDEQTSASLAATLEKFEPAKYDVDRISQAAEAFSPNMFRNKLMQFIKTIHE